MQVLLYCNLTYHPTRHIPFPCTATLNNSINKRKQWNNEQPGGLLICQQYWVVKYRQHMKNWRFSTNYLTIFQKVT